MQMLLKPACLPSFEGKTRGDLTKWKQTKKQKFSQCKLSSDKSMQFLNRYLHLIIWNSLKPVAHFPSPSLAREEKWIETKCVLLKPHRVSPKEVSSATTTTATKREWCTWKVHAGDGYVQSRSSHIWWCIHKTYSFRFVFIRKVQENQFQFVFVFQNQSERCYSSSKSCCFLNFIRHTGWDSDIVSLWHSPLLVIRVYGDLDRAANQQLITGKRSIHCSPFRQLRDWLQEIIGQLISWDHAQNTKWNA